MSNQTTTDPMLAVFLDRTTMRHERHYPHPIERVWEAVTTAEHLDVWLLPVSKVERRLGGRCAFSWGGPAEESIEGVVSRFEPPTVVEYRFGHPKSFLRFELEREGAGTRLWFVQSFAPGEQPIGTDDAHDGADRPAGPDTPWRPGFVAGFHEFLDQLGLWLEGRWGDAENAAYFDSRAGHLQWIDIYRAHIRDHCPPT